MPPLVTVATASRVYRVAPSASAPRGLRPQALAYAEVTDELTGRAPDVRLTVVGEGGGTPTGGVGIGGLAGRPADALPEIATQPYPVSFSVSAPGYLPVQVRLDLAQEPGGPDAFRAAPPVPLALHRTPVVVSGSVLDLRGVPPAPLAGATVVTEALWRAFPGPASTLALALEPPVAVSRAAAPSLRRRTVAFAGAEAALTRDAHPGALRLALSDGVGMGTLPRLIHVGEGAGAEIVEVVSATDSEAGWPAEVTLATPLAYRHLGGAVVRRLAAPVFGPAQTLEASVVAGDAVVFPQAAGALAALPDGDWAEVAGGGPVEVRRLRHLQAATDADGRFRFPAINRIARLQLRVTLDPTTTPASHPALWFDPVVISLRYGQPVQAESLSVS